MKYCFLFSFLILSFQQLSLKPVPPEVPKYIAGACFLFPIISQIEWGGIDKIHGRPGGWCTSPALAQTIVAGSIMAAIAYYISKSYTPKGVYLWAFGLEEKAKELLSLHKKFLIKEHTETLKTYEIVKHLRALHFLHVDLNSATSYLESAPKDLPGDILFKDDCKRLSERLLTYARSIEIKALQYYSKFLEIYATRTSDSFYPLGSIESVTYSFFIDSDEKYIFDWVSSLTRKISNIEWAFILY